mgnify:CR=1 FL=1
MNLKAKKEAEKIWKKFGNPKNEDRIYTNHLIYLIDAIAGGRTYLFDYEIERLPGVKMILSSINDGKFYDRKKFDKGLKILSKKLQNSFDI